MLVRARRRTRLLGSPAANITGSGRLRRVGREV